jgi:regulator of RNase E activity RraB
MILLLAIAVSAASVPNPRAAEFFDAQPVLKSWALQAHDSNHDGWLTLYEATAAADEFRAMADSDHDGRVTVRELESAKAFLASRLGLRD